jgi:hypothetical protein
MRWTNPFELIVEVGIAVWLLQIILGARKSHVV